MVVGAERRVVPDWWRVVPKGVGVVSRRGVGAVAKDDKRFFDTLVT